VPDGADAHVLQVFRRQVRQDLLADRVLAEGRIILTTAKVSEPRPNIYARALAAYI
jgi:hypothetical protein